MSLAEYIQNIVDIPMTTNIQANETWYMFGNNENSEPFKSLKNLYDAPTCISCTKGTVTLGIAGQGSGVSFHLHGPGFSEPIIGSKRWFLFRPGYGPAGGFAAQANKTVASFAAEISDLVVVQLQQQNGVTSSSSSLSSLSPASLMSSTPFNIEVDPAISSSSSSSSSSNSDTFFDCTIYPGELIYFPANWYHATYNLASFNAFVSFFT